MKNILLIIGLAVTACAPTLRPITSQPATVDSNAALRFCLDYTYTASFSGSPSLIENSAPSSKLTTMDTATRAPPGQCGSGGEPAYPSRSRVLVPAWRICGIRY